jgi:hypothetical protein
LSIRDALKGLCQCFHILYAVTVDPKYRSILEVTMHQDFKLLGANTSACESAAIALMTIARGADLGMTVVTA